MKLLSLITSLFIINLATVNAPYQKSNKSRAKATEKIINNQEVTTTKSSC